MCHKSVVTISIITKREDHMPFSAGSRILYCDHHDRQLISLFSRRSGMEKLIITVEVHSGVEVENILSIDRLFGIVGLGDRFVQYAISPLSSETPISRTINRIGFKPKLQAVVLSSRCMMHDRFMPYTGRCLRCFTKNRCRIQKRTKLQI